MVPDPPVTIDLASSTVAPAVLASGSTSPLTANGIFNRGSLGTSYGTTGSEPGFYWVTGGQSYWAFRDSNGGTERWKSPDVGAAVADPDPVSPDLVEAWSAANGSTGTLVVVRSAPIPVAVGLGNDADAVAATLSTNLTGSNNDLIFTSVLSGRLGNVITVRYVSPGTNNAALAVTVSERAITVNLATNGSAVVTSTAALVKAAIEASAAASALVTVANKAANDGSGVVTAMGATALSGGSGGLPLPPEILAL